MPLLHRSRLFYSSLWLRPVVGSHPVAAVVGIRPYLLPRSLCHGRAVVAVMDPPRVVSRPRRRGVLLAGRRAVRRVCLHVAAVVGRLMG